MNLISAICRSTICILVVTSGAQVSAGETIADTPFLQEYREAFVQGETTKLNDANAITVDGRGTVWVATSGGVCRVADEKLLLIDPKTINGPTFDVETDDNGIVWIGAWNGLYRLVDGTIQRVAGLDTAVGAVKHVKGRLFASTPDGVLEKEGDNWKLISGPWSTGCPEIAIADDSLYVASAIGLFRKNGSEVDLLDQDDGMLSRNLRGIVADADGGVWAGSRAGIDLVRDGKHVRSFSPSDGLPSTDVRSVAVGPDGRIWIGTAMGLVRYDGKSFSLRHSLRWLPSDEVRDVAFSPDGTAWIATNKGVSSIRQRTMTLADKAKYFLDLVRARHVRKPGLVEHTRLKVPGDLSSWEDMDTDNDGSYSGLYLNAECYRYAVTGAKDARQNAIDTFRALEFLQTVTGTSGFVARTVVPADWTSMADGNRTYTDQEVAEHIAEDPRWKKVEKRWRPSADGKWLWKGDTSSDETSGHFYAYSVYYDLVADAAEKKRVAALVRRIMDYIIDGGYVFRDIDGEATRWGVWAPEKLNHDPNWSLERGCNSVEILSYLTVAKHITGDPKYEREIEKLLKEHHYDENILQPMTPHADYFTYIGYELLAMSYPALMKYETNPERKALYRKSLDAWFSPIRKDASPMYSFVYAAYSDGSILTDGCAEILRDLPLDQIEWLIDNSHREDVKLVHRPAEDRWQTERLLPASERPVFRWDRNVYYSRNGNGGREEGSSVVWLLPYWMGRHYNLITAPE
jgi:hypothetical protein